MSPKDPPRANPPKTVPPAVAVALQIIESTELFRGHTEVLIRHNGREYRLRHTRLGKLILTA